MTVRVAIASGKGGTGKTTLSVNLAALLADQGLGVRLLDADVEEPDCHLFLHPQDESSSPVDVLVPVVDLGQRGYWQPTWPYVLWFWTAVLAGWTLVTAVIAGFTSAFRRH